MHTLTWIYADVLTLDLLLKSAAISQCISTSIPADIAAGPQVLFDVHIVRVETTLKCDKWLPQRLQNATLSTKVGGLADHWYLAKPSVLATPLTSGN